MEFTSNSALETQKIAAQLAAEVLNKPAQTTATVITLAGELGAGKTTFAQGFTRALGIDEKVKSPTFLLIKSYALRSKSYVLLYHIDCYRIHDPKELVSVGLQDILSDPHHMVLIEWPERIESALPPQRTKINFEHVDENTRKIIIT